MLILGPPTFFAAIHLGQHYASVLYNVSSLFGMNYSKGALDACTADLTRRTRVLPVVMLAETSGCGRLLLFRTNAWALCCLSPSVPSTSSTGSG